MYATMENEKVMRDAIARTDGRRGLAALGRNFAALMRQRVRRAAVARQLMALDDRMLSDIGLERWQINEVADRVVAEAHAPVSSPSATIGAFFKTSVVQPIVRAYQRHAAFRELSALDDRLLKDIGITRGEIPAVVHALSMIEAGRDDRIQDAQNGHDLVRSLRLWNRSRFAAKDLNALDDRTLSDIGLVRGDVNQVAEELAQQSLRKPANRNGTRQAA
ncbi:DUF1127 domain-containing protein [Rhodospirillaceae bacterium SYSU D60014]|uniref:DUF1127 domain-containing protein n=1 Tax=Virgifigura deserti TaxID=2268457 RepID=UPI000E65ED0E